jgi:hypothetical protein
MLDSQSLSSTSSIKMPKPPFNMLISGITNCGKTHYALDLIENWARSIPPGSTQAFDYIVIYCPTYLVNETYDRKFIYDDKDVIVVTDDNLDEMLEKNMEFFSGSATLFLIDDCANLHDSKMKESAICKLAFHGRHHNISTWIITQKYNAIVKDFRDNIRMLVLFFDKDRDSMESALKQNNIIPKEQINDVLNTLKNNRGSKLIMRLEHPFDYKIE